MRGSSSEDLLYSRALLEKGTSSESSIPESFRNDHSNHIHSISICIQCACTRSIYTKTRVCKCTVTAGPVSKHSLYLITNCCRLGKEEKHEYFTKLLNRNYSAWKDTPILFGRSAEREESKLICCRTSWRSNLIVRSRTLNRWIIQKCPGQQYPWVFCYRVRKVSVLCWTYNALILLF